VGRRYYVGAARFRNVQLPGDCYNNAFMESCFGTIKTELEMTEYENRGAALKEIDSYLAYYNFERTHSALGYPTSIQFENLKPAAKLRESPVRQFRTTSRVGAYKSLTRIQQLETLRGIRDSQQIDGDDSANAGD